MSGRSDVLAVVNATVVDGTGAPPAHGRTVVVEGRRITWIGPDDLAPAVPDHARVDAGGRSVLPGLINAHVHLIADGAPDFASQLAGDSLPMTTMRAVANARATLQSGITTVRDCGAPDGSVIELGRAIDAGLLDGPRIVAAGRVLTMTGGHGYFVGREVDGVDSVRRGVRSELREGAGFIKAMATGGVLTPGRHPGQVALMPDELTWVVREAHNAGVRVATHAIGDAGIRNALEAGVDSIEHGFGLHEGVLELAIDRGAFVVPTLLAVTGIIDGGVERGTPSWVVDKALEQQQRSQEMFRAAVRSGMKIAAGTDAGTPFNHHEDLAREIELMAELGLSPLEAIVAATSAAAENLDLTHLVGTLETGKLADLVVFDGDVLADLGRLRRPLLVVKDGQVVRDVLSAPAPDRSAYTS